MTRAIIVAALLLGGATGPLLVADAAFAKELAPTSSGVLCLTSGTGQTLILALRQG